MRTGITISTVGHAAALLWGLLAFAANPYKADPVEAMPIDIISATDFSQITAGSKTAAKVETAKPKVEKVAPPKPAEDPTAKVDTKEIKAATDTPPPVPEPKPKPKPPVAEKKQAEPKPEPKRDLIAEALKKEDQKKKQEQKKEEQKKEEQKKEAKVTPPTPPKKPTPPQPKFDPRTVAALLDKRAPQRLAATGDVINDMVSLGAPTGLAAQLSQSELDALRARLAQLWSPPAGAKNPEELVVLIRMQLKPDGSLAGPPMVMTSGKTPLFMASRDSAIRAVMRGQPFDMLRPEHYEQWKDIEITFDPRDMIRG